MTRRLIGYIETKLVLAALLTACLCGATVWGIHRHLCEVHADTAQLVATNLRSRHLVRAMATIQDAETGQRGYLLTGRDDYLQPYLRAVRDIDADLAALRADFAEDELAKLVVAAIGQLVPAKFAEMKDTVELRRRQGFEAAREVVLQDTGRHIMDGIRADIGHLLEAQRGEIDRMARRRSAAALQAANLWVGAVIAVLLPVGFCLILAIRDARRNRHERAQLAHVSSHDALTGLLNRPALLTRLDRALSLRPREVGLLFLDLNGFKAINDELGHAVGDRVLVEVARHLPGALRPSDLVARLGGDEFVVMIEPCPDRQLLETLADRVEIGLDAIHLPELGRRRIGGSVGVAHSAEGGGLGAALLKAADDAMYERKAQLRQMRADASRLHLVTAR